MDKTGGPAFPETHYSGNTNRHPSDQISGMTLRDYFAAHAPQHRVDFESPSQMLDFLGRANVTPGWDGKARDAAAVQAKLAYIYADAMIAARQSTSMEGGEG